jgi:adenine-specific DNA-methyltransferase
VKRGVVPTTYWAEDAHEFPETLGSVSWDHQQSGHSQTGVDELSAIVGRDHGFKTAKPLRLMQKIIQIWCPPDGLVLDPFAGSGTTAHAVLALNYVADADRRFILIEQGRPERGDSYARSLTAERLKRVIDGNWANGKVKPSVADTASRP